MRFLYLVSLCLAAKDLWQEYLIESDVSIPPSQQHLIARITANKLIEQQQLTVIDNALTSALERDKIYYSNTGSDQSFNESQFVEIKSVREVDLDSAYELFTSDDRPKVISFDPIKTLYCELEMLPDDGLEDGSEENHLRLWFNENIQTSETDGSSLAFTYDSTGIHIPFEHKDLFTDDIIHYISDFIRTGHIADHSVRF